MSFLGETIRVFTDFPGPLLTGVFFTVALTFCSLLLGVSLGIVLALVRISAQGKKRKGLNGFLLSLPASLSQAYIELIRGTPLLLQLFVFFFGFAQFGLMLDKFTSAVLALGLNSAAYVSEIIRAGIQAVDKGQSEAARSLGLSSGKTMRYVVLPQAVRNILPALGNEFVVMIKESSLASVFFVGEIMTAYKAITNSTFAPMQALVAAGIIYFVLTFSLSKLVSFFERRMSADV